MFSLSAKVFFAIIFCLSLHSQAKLAVYGNDELANQMDPIKGIDYTILTPQNKITYKKSFIGSLTLAQPDETGCGNVTSIDTVGPGSSYTPILIVSWGTCHYIQKVKNAEAAGAKMILIVLRHDLQGNHPEIRQISMATNIEVLAVAKSHGDILMNYMREKGKDAPVEITYTAEREKHPHYDARKEATVEFWFSASDVSGTSYQFLSDLREILRQFTGHFVFHPHYVVWQAQEQERSHSRYRCVSNGLYCDPEHYTEGKLSGSEGVVEDLVQISLKRQSKLEDLDSDWWTYVKYFGSNCLARNAINVDDCRREAYKNLKTSRSEIERMVFESFEERDRPKKLEDCKDTTADNTELASELKDRNKLDVDHYPALYVNKERYTASFRNKNAVKDFICSHLVQDQVPDICDPTKTKSTNKSTSHDVGTYFIIVFVSILLMIIMLYCVRRTVKRQVMGRMNDEISHIVTQYKQFKDKSNTSGADDDI